MGMRVDIVTLFPEMCQQVLDASIIGLSFPGYFCPGQIQKF